MKRRSLLNRAPSMLGFRHGLLSLLLFALLVSSPHAMAKIPKAKKKNVIGYHSRPIHLKTTGAFIGDEVPLFSLRDVDGKIVNLRQFRGKHVIIEWFNDACPQVKTLYRQGMLQKIQRFARSKKVVWLTIVAQVDHRGGALSSQFLSSLKSRMAQYKSVSSHILIDRYGKVASLLQAQNTPHMQIICPKGILLYSGAVFDEDEPKAQDYITGALKQCIHRRQVMTPVTTTNGCPVVHYKPPRRFRRRR